MIKNLIYDIGMNKGNDTAYYLHRGFWVVAIEADPTLVWQAQKRFEQEIAEGKLLILNVGIADHEGKLPFWICDSHPEWSSFNQEIASRDGAQHHAITVDSYPFRSVVEEHGVPYYLKIDIEGNDFLCLKDLEKGNLPKYLSIESSLGVDLLTPLHELGYTSFKCISQRNFLPLEISSSNEETSKAFTEGTYLPKNWTFPEGSSGPFGEDLLGEWQSFEQMQNTYEHFKSLKEKGAASIFWDDKDYSFWADFHVRCDSLPD